MKEFAYNISGFLHLLTFKDYVIIGLVFVILILLLVIYYILKVKEIDKEENESNIIVKEENDELDLEAISKEIEQVKPVFLTDYEESQEKEAIISYQELLNKSGDINFSDISEDEYQNFEVKIKKINLDDPKQTIKPIEKLKSVPLMSYQSDDDFLIALKKLQNNLSK